jgi:hypothetical protein
MGSSNILVDYQCIIIIFYLVIFSIVWLGFPSFWKLMLYIIDDVSQKEKEKQLQKVLKGAW